MKYLPSMIVTSALLLAVVVPAFARGHQDERGVSVENTARLRNTSIVVANTGLNSTRDEESRICTGMADAYSTTTVARVNQTTLGHNGEQLRLENNANIRNISVVVANTGLNSTRDEESSIRTGTAIAEGHVTVSDVNVTGFGH